ncbi:MAG: hypothetical protein H6739_32555 [Alphaproteobacteria bacterium]|nr:hypothetical protein [Alphaproteobacteria bacterium]
MSALRIIYRVVRVRYTGESIGRDWSFFIHTGAGLVRFDARLNLGANDRTRRVVGVREVEAEGAVEERWWVSALERDPSWSDNGVSLETPVAFYAGEGVDVSRSFNLTVHERVFGSKEAQLEVWLEARVVSTNGDAPALDAEVVDTLPDPAAWPSRVAGALPAHFRAEAEGVSGPVAVEARETLRVTAASEVEGTEAEVFKTFLTTFTWAGDPLGFTPTLVLYEVRSPNQERIWASRNSSMGRRTQERIAGTLAEALPPLSAQNEGFAQLDSAVTHLLAEANTGTLGPRASALSAVVAALVEDAPDRAPVDRTLLQRTSYIDDYSGCWTFAMFVDPMILRGPDERVWLLVWTDGWVE